MRGEKGNWIDIEVEITQTDETFDMMERKKEINGKWELILNTNLQQHFPPA